MKVRLSNIPPEGIRLSFEIDIGGLPGIRLLAESESCAFPGSFRVTLNITPRSDLYVANGSFKGPVELTCVRCLGRFHSEIFARFDITFKPGAEETEIDGADDIELREADADVMPLEGDEIDFAPIIEEQVLMNFPMQPICQQECKGLCPRCGVDLNQRSCRCPEQEVDPRLAVLKQLKKNLPE